MGKMGQETFEDPPALPVPDRVSSVLCQESGCTVSDICDLGLLWWGWIAHAAPC